MAGGTKKRSGRGKQEAAQDAGKSAREQGIDPQQHRAQQFEAYLDHQLQQAEADDGPGTSAAGESALGGAAALQRLLPVTQVSLAEVQRAVRNAEAHGLLRKPHYVFNTFAAALRGSLQSHGSALGFAARLRSLEDEHCKSCDTDVGGCGTMHPVRQVLEGGLPRVFTVQLVWESQREDPATIGCTLRAVGEEVDLGELYCGVPPGTMYRLRSMVCYYGRHYSAFVYLPEMARWVMFDDSSASSAGTWADVRKRCEDGHGQPSVLFFEAVE